jgi:hypothetical protein
MGIFDFVKEAGDALGSKVQDVVGDDPKLSGAY